MINLKTKKLFSIAVSLIFSFINIIAKQDIIIDSHLSFNEAISGTKAPKSVIDSLCLLDVKYYSVDRKIHQGQIIVNKAVKSDIAHIFDLIFKDKFVINKVIPIVKYNWSDDASMEDNNTSAFCYRNIAGKNKLSNHSFGRAIDINPYFNPVEYHDGKTSPKNAKHIIGKPGTFDEKNKIVIEFKKLGWRWGGNFSEYNDNHHFDKIQ